ncbi:MAG TPA: 30S ribosomal protein S3 [Anaerolineae bacterium]|nr:30S ribosomal protein S3 [Anaerolineae bacterium]
MGRKINPYGFRLGVIYDWKSRWYAKKGKQYAQLLAEDFELRKFIRSKVSQAGVSKIDIERFPNQVIVTIFTAKPGIIIGRKGAAVKELREAIEQQTGKKVKLEISEIEKPDLEAQLVAENITGQIERRISHSRAMKRAVQQAMRMGAEGVKITASGRLAGSEMARRETVMEGRVPRSTLRANIDFAEAEALTTYGRIGVKVWIYKGEILPEAKTEQPAAQPAAAPGV